MAKKKFRPGMGALVHEKGTAFRVWAPHANRVSIKGEFNGWSDEANLLSSEKNGFWYGDIPGAKHGQEYKYVLWNGEQRLEKRDPYSRQVTNSSGNSVIYDPTLFDWEGDQFEINPHNELVIYEMHVGSFFTEKDGRAGGFDDVLKKIDHLKHLGINAIQVMPVSEFAGDFSWGYNPAEIYAVESTYGGPDAYKRFIRAVHQEGIAVIQDVVYNHFGPSDLDIWQFDGWSENGLGGIYFYNDWRAHTPWGATRPDYGRDQVRAYIHDNTAMWLDEYHVDGLRFDMTAFIRSVDGSDGSPIPEGWTLMQYINGGIRARGKRYLLISEDLKEDDQITEPTTTGGAGFHCQWDPRFVHPVRSVVGEVLDEHRLIGLLRDALTRGYSADAFRRVVYSESHDEVANGRARVPQEVNPQDPQGWHAQKRSTLAAGLVFTAPGIPMIFQGQEFLQGDYFRDDVPLDWHLNETFQGIVRLYRDLIHLRLNRSGNTRGLMGQYVNIFHLDEAQDVIAFQRWDQHGAGDDVVVVCNFSHAVLQDYVIGLPNPGVWKLRLNSDSRDYGADFGAHPSFDCEGFAGGADGLDCHGSISIGPYSLLIYSQDA